jgi:hypothetical protein
MALMLTKECAMQLTIPDAVLARIVQHRPHLAAIAANVRAGVVPEKALAVAYLAGETAFSATDTLHLAQVAYGGPWGGAWDTTAMAAARAGVTDGRIRQKALSGELQSMKRGGVLYVRRAKG